MTTGFIIKIISKLLPKRSRKYWNRTNNHRFIKLNLFKILMSLPSYLPIPSLHVRLPRTSEQLQMILVIRLKHLRGWNPPQLIRPNHPADRTFLTIETRFPPVSYLMVHQNRLYVLIVLLALYRLRLLVQLLLKLFSILPCLFLLPSDISQTLVINYHLCNWRSSLLFERWVEELVKFAAWAVVVGNVVLWIFGRFG